MDNQWKKFLIYGLEFFFGLNVLLVDIWVYTQTHQTAVPATTKQAITPTSTPTPTPDTSRSPTLSPTPVVYKQTVVEQNPLVKEFFIPLGSGQTDATDWTDIPGAIGYADSTAYPSIKKVVLEATVIIPNGNETAWIRLFDKTDGHPVWYSETSWSGGDTQLLISQPFTLDTGNKLYQVQLKNQLPSVSIVTNARIHITLQ